MSVPIGTEIQIEAQEEIDESFLFSARTWIEEVLRIEERPFSPPRLLVSIWRTMEKYRDFYAKEKKDLGVVTGEESDFLATHDAWRGYPRIHICQERLMGIDRPVIRGAIHHETAHALHHGTPEFYTFRFSRRLQEIGGPHGLSLPLLQQCVYLVSVAIKDQDVILWLATHGLGASQLALLGFLLLEAEEERRGWEVVRENDALRKIAFAAFLKILLPIEAMVSHGLEGANALMDRWDKVYAWLSETERKGLFLLARSIVNLKARTFQDRLEQATIELIYPS